MRMGTHHRGLQIGGNGATLRHPDTGSDTLDNIDNRQVCLVVLCQRNSAFNGKLTCRPRLHYTKNILESLHITSSTIYFDP